MRIYSNIFFIVAIAASMLPLCHAATVYGNVYDISLEKVAGARISVNTTPIQSYIATDGSYSFDIANGHYTIMVEMLEGRTIIAAESRNVSIREQGKYVLDFILFPAIDEDDAFIDALDIPLLDDEQQPQKKSNASIAVIFVLLVFLVIAFVFVMYTKRKKRREKKEKDWNGLQGDAAQKPHRENEKEDELEHILAIIKKEGGRVTQKDIRKAIPLSEAKISLMITELEHKGRIEKIKKGRGNVILLKK